MDRCGKCGARHPKTKVVAVDSWAWVRGDAHPANTEAWFKQQEESHRARGKLFRRTFVKRVKAGRAVVEVTVAVLQTREPWVCNPAAPFLGSL
jgi:hypothetical protein